MQRITTYLTIENLFALNVALFFLSVLIIFINRISIIRIKRKYKNLLNDIDKGGVGKKLDEYFNVASEIKEDYNATKSRIKELESVVNLSVKKIGIVRYNAFDNVGSDLSYSIALLDNNDDGIVFSGLYSRENTATYAKPINDSLSTYKLSDEEVNAIKAAKESFKNRKNIPG